MAIHLNPDKATILAELGACVLALIALFWLRSTSLAFAAFGPADVTKLLTPLVLTAAFIERAVEVLISPWRDPDANKLAQKVTTAKAAPEPDAPAFTQKLASVASAADDLSSYKGQTQRFAFLTSLTVGLIASLAGVRALTPFLKPDALNALNPAQHALFIGFDVVLTAALLAGGADGLHSVISAFTSFFDSTAQRATNAS
ncbi:MAG: hypothetical protein ACYCPS_05270 [Candidatus Saccharimonadales bacterium]